MICPSAFPGLARSVRSHSLIYHVCLISGCPSGHQGVLKNF